MEKTRFYKTEVIKDDYGFNYSLKVTKRNGKIVGKAFDITNKYVAEFYGKTKKEVLKNALQNITIIIYD